MNWKVCFKHPALLSNIEKLSVRCFRCLISERPEPWCYVCELWQIIVHPRPFFLQLNNMICQVEATTCQFRTRQLRFNWGSDDFILTWDFKRALLLHQLHVFYSAKITFMQIESLLTSPRATCVHLIEFSRMQITACFSLDTDSDSI